MEQIVPTLSSSTVGPLGIRHLPRLWLKVLLHAVGALPEGYRHGNGGFDEMTLVALGVDPAAFVAYVERELPTYLACEAWIRAHATKLDPETIARHNEEIRTRMKPDEAAAEQRAYIGIEAPHLRHGVLLNDLDDWKTVHAQVVARHRARREEATPT